MPLLTVRDRARATVHRIDGPIALDTLFPSPPPVPYDAGWLLRPDGRAVDLVSPTGTAHERIAPGDALSLGDVTLALEEPAPGSLTERLALDALPRLQLALPDGRRIALVARALTIGRHSRCDIVLADPTVSDLHCRLIPSRGAWAIEDARSTNGTRVNGVRVESATLAPGVSIVLGRTKVLCVRDPADALPTLPSSIASGVLVGDSPAMEAVRDAVERYASRTYPVLVRGETGSGKELVARMLHDRSTRARGPFVAINAATIAPDLVESELFGHERGAFTGANTRRRGVFEEASGGTLFLDELGELPLAQQAKLLRVLETGEVRRVGAEGSVRVDVRVVCATHRDLAARASEGLFRVDLLYRLDVLRVRLPPLRERAEDLPALAQHLMARVSAELSAAKRLEDRALAALLAHDWPGNVRELYGVLRRAACEADGERVGLEHLSLARDAGGRKPPRESGFFTPPPPPPVSTPASAPRAREPNAAEMRAMLETCEGNVSRAAAALGIARSTLRDRITRER